MKWKFHLVVLLVGFVCCFNATKDDCESLGFVGESLSCRTCQTLRELTKNEQLKRECLSCCLLEQEEEQQQEKIHYEKAVLRCSVSSHLTSVHPDLLTFIEHYQEKMENLSIVRRAGSPPDLFLFQKQDATSYDRKISLIGWSLDDLTSFFVKIGFLKHSQE